MGCEFCTDSNGEDCYPSYGPAPHICYKDIPGACIGESVTLPRDQWPDGFTEQAPGMGIYWCALCGSGKP